MRRVIEITWGILLLFVASSTIVWIVYGYTFGSVSPKFPWWWGLAVCVTWSFAIPVGIRRIRGTRRIRMSEFEVAVLEWIRTRSDDAALRDQLARARVVRRKYTVVGCYSTLSVPSDTQASASSYASHGPLQGPHFASKVVDHGGGTLIWFAAGRAVCLEIYAHGSYFPADHSELGDFQLSSAP